MRTLLVAILVTFAGAAWANTPVDGCFVREYDPAHLAAHPEQTVVRFFLVPAREQEAHFDAVLEFGFRLRNGNDYAGVAYCADASCSVEGDGGGFRLARDGDAIRLTVDGALALEGEADFSPDLADSDDRVFRLLPRPASACR